MSVCAVVAAAGLCIFGAFHGDPVERAVARGDLHAAQTELKQRKVADAGARSYDAGRIAEAQKSYHAAVARYLTASRQGDDRGIQRLIDMTRDPSCVARSAAASGLGKVRDDRALRALKELRSARFADEHGRKRARRSSCNSAVAARKALKRAKKQKA